MWHKCAYSVVSTYRAKRSNASISDWELDADNIILDIVFRSKLAFTLGDTDALCSPGVGYLAFSCCLCSNKRSIWPSEILSTDSSSVPSRVLFMQTAISWCVLGHNFKESISIVANSSYNLLVRRRTRLVLSNLVFLTELVEEVQWYFADFNVLLSLPYVNSIV